MGWLDNLLGMNDPSQAASLALGTNLLSTGGPSKMPISMGQAIGNALMGARDAGVGTQNDILKRQLVQAQILKAMNDLKYGNAPANVRTAMWYANDATPAERNAFASTVRSAEVKSYNGINYIRDLTTGEWRPMLPIEEQVRNLDLGAATTSGATAREKARWDVEPTFSPQNNQFMFTSKYDLARAAGAPAGPPSVAPRLPNALGIPSQAPSGPAPYVPRTGTPNVAPAGIPADGFRTQEDLRAWLQSQAGQDFYNGQNPTQPSPQPSSPSVALPKEAGTAFQEEEKKVGGGRGDLYNKIVESSMTSRSTLAKINRMEQLLAGVETGKLTPFGTEVASYLASLDIPIDPKLDNKQAIRSLTSELALMARKPGTESGGMPGNFSDQDRNFLVAMMPGLVNTPGANRLIIETAKKAAQREQEVADLAFMYRAKNKTMAGFEIELKKWADAHPLFTEEIKQAQQLTSGVPRAGVNTFSDPEKERRYQEWKRSQGMAK